MYGIRATHRGPSVTAPLQHLLQFRYCSVAPPSSVTASARAPLQFRCTSVTTPLPLPCTSVTAPLQLPLQLSYTAPLQLRRTSVTAPQLSCTAPLQFRYRSVIKLLLLLRLRYSFRCSIATASITVPLQNSDTAPLQLRSTILL